MTVEILKGFGMGLKDEFNTWSHMVDTHDKISNHFSTSLRDAFGLTWQQYGKLIEAH